MSAAQWHTLRLLNVQRETEHSYRFFFKLEEKPYFTFMPGQFLTCDLPLGEKRIQRWRSYSIANRDFQNGEIEFCISYKENGPASNYFFHVINIGDTIRTKSPEGTFLLPEVQKGILCMVCTGTGISPFRAMLQEISLRGHNYESIHLIFGTRRATDILYRDEFSYWHHHIPNFHSHICLSRDSSKGLDIPKESILYEGYVHQAYNNLIRENQSFKEKSTFLLCGWSTMIDEAVLRLLTEHQLKRDQIKYELFG